MLANLGSSPKRILMGILALSILARIASAVYLGNEVVVLPGTFDQVSYHNLALRVLNGHGFSFGRQWWPATAADAPTAHWSFLYTLYLVAVYAISGSSPLVARLLQAILVGILMPWLIYRLARHLFAADTADGSAVNETGLSRADWIGLVAAAITAIYIYFIYYAAALMTESFYFVSILWSFDLSMQIARSKESAWRQWMMLGLALAVTVLLRQLFLLFVPFLLLWLWWAVRPKIRYPGVTLLIVLLCMLPFTIRNYLVFDQIVLLNTNAGYAFFWGNHPIYGTSFVPILTPDMGSYLSLIPSELLHLNEAAMDTALLKIALDNIFQDPGRYLLLSLSRIPPYFMFWPSGDSAAISNFSRMASFGLFLPFMLYGLLCSIRSTLGSLRESFTSPTFLLYLFMVIYSGIHFLTWTLVRYRLPVDSVLVIFAGLALVELAKRFGLGQHSLRVDSN